MRCAFGAKKRFYASIMMTALLMLHVALASISPFKLFDNITNGGFDSYIRAMDISSINSLATNPDNRTRTRSRSASIIDAQILHDTPTSFIRTDTEFLATALFVFETWNRLVGRELSSKPHTDMVARK